VADGMLQTCCLNLVACNTRSLISCPIYCWLGADEQLTVSVFLAQVTVSGAEVDFLSLL
jgi:hypothetical protein